MKSANGIFLAIVICAVLAVAVFFLVDLSADKVYASPEEAFQAARVALQKNDMRTWCRCLTDDSRDMLLLESIELTPKETLEIAPNEKKAIIRAKVDAQAKHGLTEEYLFKMQDEFLDLQKRKVPLEGQLRFARKLLAPVSDPNALFADLINVTVKESGGRNPFSSLADAKLNEVKVSGKTAEGTISGGRGPSPFYFRKQGDGWRIDLIGPEQRQTPPPPAFHR